MLISISQCLWLPGNVSDFSGKTRFTSLWLSGLAWWLHHRFLLGFSDGYSSLVYSVGSSSFLCGRFSSEGIRFRNSFSSYLPVYQTSSGPRLPYFLEKVADTSFPRLPVFGGTLQDRFRSDVSTRGTISVTLTENSYFQQQSFIHGSTILSTTELSECPSRCGSSRSPSHSNSPHFFLQEHWDSASEVVPILPVLLPHLDWWTRKENVLTGVALLHSVPSLPLYSDSSLQGWGAFLEGKSVSGMWSLVQQQEHINLLEMRAVILALQHF